MSIRMRRAVTEPVYAIALSDIREGAVVEGAVAFNGPGQWLEVGAAAETIPCGAVVEGLPAWAAYVRGKATE